MPDGLLALDLATVAGWAYVEPAAVLAWPATALEARARKTPPEGVWSGTLRLAPSGLSDGAFMIRAQQAVADMIAVHRPDAVIYEAVISEGFKSPAAAFRMIGLAVLTEMACETAGVLCRSLSAQSIKKSWAGHGRASKAQMFAEARARGFHPRDHNEADALAVADHAIAILRRRYQRLAAPAAVNF